MIVISDARGLSRLAIVWCVAAVTLASASIVATILALAGTPYAILSASARAAGSEVAITLVHRGGDTFPTEELMVLAENESGLFSSVAMRWGGEFSAGDESLGAYKYGGSPAGRKIELRVLHRPTRQELLKVELWVEPSEA